MATGAASKKQGVGRHISRMKRARQNTKRRESNKKVRTTLKNVVRATRTNPNDENLRKAISKLAKAGRKHLIHPRKAARLISRLTRTVNKASA